MASFGRQSRKCRDECDVHLQRVLNEAIKHYDFTCIWGHRNKVEQDKAYIDGYSKLKWPQSKHNKRPAQAFDVVPYPDGFRASDTEFHILATHILGAACKLGVHLRWGGHWKNLKDLAHYQLMDD